MLGSEIEALSFQIIQREVSFERYSTSEAEIVARVIHASADPEFANTMRFSPDAAEHMLNLISSKALVITDVRSLTMSINTLPTVCALEEGFTTIEGKTRTYAAMRHAAKQFRADALYVVGCAPTALEALIELSDSMEEPLSIVALPVGYVGAAESKESLIDSSSIYITNTGRRGGTAVTAAVINAIGKMALGEFSLKH